MIRALATEPNRELRRRAFEAELAAWKLTREQWAGSERTWGDANNAAVQLALRGRDPFAGEFDDPDGVRFRELATRLFDALVHGRDVDARTGAAA